MLTTIHKELVKYLSKALAMHGDPCAVVERLFGLGFGDPFTYRPELAQAHYFPGRLDKLIAAFRANDRSDSASAV